MTRLFADPSPASLFWTGLAFLAAYAVFWLARRKGPILLPAWVAIVLLCAAGLLPVFGYLWSLAPYHLHVTVVGPPGVAVDHARVWSSAQNESTKKDGEWRIEIPGSLVPADRTILVWAALDPADTTHSRAVRLADDHNPAVTIRISGDRSATVAGVVRDLDGKPVERALVSRAGEPGAAILTEENGRFVIPVNAQEGDQVRVQVAVFGVLKTVWATAGDQSLVVYIERH